MTVLLFVIAFASGAITALFATRWTARPVTSVTRTVNAGTITATLRLDSAEAQASLKSMLKDLNRFDNAVRDFNDRLERVR